MGNSKCRGEAGRQELEQPFWELLRSTDPIPAEETEEWSRVGLRGSAGISGDQLGPGASLHSIAGPAAVRAPQVCAEDGKGSANGLGVCVGGAGGGPGLFLWIVRAC